MSCGTACFFYALADILAGARHVSEQDSRVTVDHEIVTPSMGRVLHLKGDSESAWVTLNNKRVFFRSTYLFASGVSAWKLSGFTGQLMISDPLGQDWCCIGRMGVSFLVNHLAGEELTQVYTNHLG
jgi:hypothetical protein